MQVGQHSSKRCIPQEVLQRVRSALLVEVHLALSVVNCGA
jgi:hypothetical protein